jgi:hypothetical protein
LVLGGNPVANGVFPRPDAGRQQIRQLMVKRYGRLMIQHTNLGTHGIRTTSWIIYAPVKSLIGKVVKTSLVIGPTLSWLKNATRNQKPVSDCTANSQPGPLC